MTSRQTNPPSITSRDADERCLERLGLRGLRDGLTAVRETVTEARQSAPELRLF